MSASGIIPVRILAHASAGALLGTRCYHEVAKQTDTRPYCIYGTTDGEPSLHLGGHGGLMRESSQVDVYADDQGSLRIFRQILLAQLHGFRGSVAVDSDTYEIRSCFVHNIRESALAPIPGKSKPIFSLTAELEIWSALVIT